MPGGTMSVFFWLDVAALGLSTVFAAALTLMVLSTGVRRAMNRAFVAFTLSEAAWAIVALLLRMSLWLDMGNPDLLLDLTGLFLSLMSISVLAFTVRYLDRPTRRADIAVGAGLLFLLGFSVPLFRHQIFYDPRLGPYGSVVNETHPVLGFVGVTVIFLYLVWALVLFWRDRHRTREPYLALSIFILWVGLLLGGVLEIGFPILSVTNTISMAVLGYGVVSRQIFNPLRTLTQNLEHEVAQRTEALSETAQALESTNTALARRSHQLEAAAQITQAVSLIREEAQLLETAVNRVAELLDVYHVGLYLLDESGEYAVLEVASSASGQRMIERGYSLRVGGSAGAVGYVSDQGQPQILVAQEGGRLPVIGHDLPETRTQVALPLRARGEIIGVLDLHSAEPGAFLEEDLSTLQILADQLALAISNVRLLARAQQSAGVSRAAYAEMSSAEWRALLSSHLDLDFKRDAQGFSGAEDLWSPQMEAAVQTGESTVGLGDRNVLAVPIMVRNQVIGVIQAHKPAGRPWPPEQVELLETLTEQLGNALDSARLYLNSQRLAQREQLTGQVTARIRQSLELEQVLQTAVDEIGAVFGAEAEIRMGLESDKAGAE
jgi:GAF domain-containing protein